MIRIQNCNNIEQGVITIEPKRLNIKYGYNGTGKTTISKAIAAKIRKDEESIKLLIPFKYREEMEIVPEIDGIDGYQSVVVFNEEYVNQYVFLEDELLKNSFEVFVKSAEYDKHIRNIDLLINGIHSSLRNDEIVDKLIVDLQDLIDCFGKTKNSYSSVSVIGKGLGNGNRLKNIPSEISMYESFLKNQENNVKWLKWQIAGKNYLTDDNICPYCANRITNVKDTVLSIENYIDSKSLDSLNRILGVFEKLKKYFADDTNNKITEISKNISGITKEQRAYLDEVKRQAVTFLAKLKDLYDLGYNRLSGIEVLKENFQQYKIDMSYLGHFGSTLISETIKRINLSIDEVNETIGKLQGEINQQKHLIEKTILSYQNEINGFLKSAGYKYEVAIENQEGDYKLKLYHEEWDKYIQGNEQHLSYGEKNAFALALFMYGALHENPDLIILDDPISSFDDNKKFAIINMLFMGASSFKDKTVLLFTHEFNLVIDTIYNFKNRILPVPKAWFLCTDNGILSEREIEKTDIKSFMEIAKQKLLEPLDIVNKVIYLRRFLELNGEKDNSWNLLSSLLHRREKPTKRTESEDVEMTIEEIKQTEMIIGEYIKGFSYDEQLRRVNDSAEMIKLYKNSQSNYEKLQVFRVVFLDAGIEDVVKQYINKTYHIENDYIFQLDPSKYNTIPPYIMKICDAMIETVVFTNK